MFKNINKGKKIVMLAIGLYVLGMSITVLQPLMFEGVGGLIYIHSTLQDKIFIILRCLIVVVVAIEALMARRRARKIFIIFGILSAIYTIMTVRFIAFLIQHNPLFVIISLVIFILYSTSAVILLISKDVKEYFSVSKKELADDDNYVD